MYEYIELLGFNPKLGKAYPAPYRKDDQPSFSLFSLADGTVLWKDFATGESGNYITLAKKLNQEVPKHYRNQVKSTETVKLFYPTLVQWTPYYLDFWKKYYVTQDLLEQHKVYPCTELVINNYTFNIDKLAYYYHFFQNTGKLYQPYSERKFLCNCKQSYLNHALDLSKTYRLIVITKSLKDVMVFRALGVPAIGVQSESIKLSPEQVYRLNQLGNKVMVIFDNDKAGKQGARKNYYSNWYYLFLDKHKDISDYIKAEGIEATKEYLTNKIWQNAKVDLLNPLL